MDTAKKIISNLALRLEQDYPGADTSLREGLEETFTVIELILPKRLRQSLQTTNVIESTLSGIRDITGNVKCWRNDSMVLRWAVVGF